MVSPRGCKLLSFASFTPARVNLPEEDRYRTPMLLFLARNGTNIRVERGAVAGEASTASASARLSASGISIWTCLPAAMHCSACAACIGVGVHRITPSGPVNREPRPFGRRMGDAISRDHQSHILGSLPVMTPCFSSMSSFAGSVSGGAKSSAPMAR